MGVPALFRWLSQKYPKIITPVIEEQPMTIDGQEIPMDTTGPNPNGEEMDNLYLDMNGIVHPCSHPEDRPPPQTEEEMMLEVFKYTERVVNMVRPRKLLMIAVDGVAPRAKMNQQRSRRFRSAQEAKDKDADNAEFAKLLRSKTGGQLDERVSAAINKKTWDSNAITPGTPFMDILAASLRYWVAYKLNTDPAWAKLKVIISDATVPGEGEHKIMEFIRSQRSSPEHDPNTRHVIYGLDADLIMLGIATHEPHFRVLREDVFFQEAKARTCRICGQKGHQAEQCRGEAKVKDGEFDEKSKAHPLKPFIWLHVSVLREYLEVELYVPSQTFRFDLERALDDWVFMCFFVGNDFLPHLPSLDIRDNGIDTLITIWRDSIPVMGDYVTKDGVVDFSRAQTILKALASQEDAIFRRRRQAEERRGGGAKRRRITDQSPSVGRYSTESVPTVSGAGARNSPNHTPPSQRGRRRGPSSGLSAPPSDLPLFAPNNITEEAKNVTHQMVINRASIYRASQSNKSAAAVLKSRLQAVESTSTEDGEKKVEHEEPFVDDAKSATPGDVNVGIISDIKATTPGDTEVAKPDDENFQDDVAVDAEAKTAGGSALGKRKAETLEEIPAPTPDPGPEDGPAEDTVRLWEEGYADRYYAQKFGVDPKDTAFRRKVAHAYAEGLAWVLLYYFQGCPSWTWYYPYHYAPFAADFTELETLDIKFEKGQPFRPFEQLMGVLPSASKHAIPEVFQGLMTDADSEIIDFYPEEFPIDLNGKKFAWQGVALLPFIDESRLLKAMASKYPLLTPEDAARNEMGKDVLLISDSHPLYDEVAERFYSKKQSSPKYKLNPRVTDGLAGKIAKIETLLPRGTLAYPLKSDSMPDVEQDRSMSVYYDIPRIGHIHKSMLLRGVRFPPPTLGQADISAARQRAARTGRSYGGAPLPADSGYDSRYGRGRADYSPNNAGNSYNPYPMPPDPNQRWYGTPPQPQAPDWPPRQPQFPSAQAYNNGFSYGYGPPGVGGSYAAPPSIGRPYVPYGGQPSPDNSGGRFQHSAPPPPPPPTSGYSRKPEGWRYPPPDNRHRRY